MKQLQNNYTTPEQSKRLLELGLPADSADMWYRCYGEFGKPLENSVVYSMLPRIGKKMTTGDIPCWSVGRLMEICDICITHEKYNGTKRTDNCLSYAELLVNTIEVMCLWRTIDFSKLEK